eukprot:scaffold138277_cov19-Tisochrysis_lutea.AAC.2
MAAAGGTGASSGSAAPSPGSGIINLAGSTEEGEQGSTRQAQPGERKKAANGKDGMDMTKVESQKVPSVCKSHERERAA